MKKAFITGGAGGLGLTIAEALEKEGWLVFAADLNKENLDKIEKENIIPIIMDVTNEESVNKAYKTVADKTDTLDAVLNFAGITFMDSLIEGDINRFKKLMDINLFGTVRTNQVFFPLIERGNGRIINISSEMGWMSVAPFTGAYSASKYALEAYNDALRRELNFLNIKVINFQLGSFKTNMHKSSEDSFNELKEKTKLYKRPVSKMGKTMKREFKNANDPKYLIDAILDALNSDKPKTNYRIKNSPQLTFISKLPESTIDKIYKKNLS